MIETCSSRILVWKHHLTSVLRYLEAGGFLKGICPPFLTLILIHGLLSPLLAVKADEYWNKVHLATRSCIKGLVCSPVTNFFWGVTFFFLVTAALYSAFLISFEPRLQ